MDYATFFKRFGGAARTKNIGVPLTGPPPGGNYRFNRRFYAIPELCELPKDYIRLCPWELEYLYMLAARAKTAIIEIGRFNGGSCFAMACAAETVPVYSVDIAPQNDALLAEHFAKAGVGANVALITGDSQQQKYPGIGMADLLFIDGDHSYETPILDKRWRERAWWSSAALGLLARR